MRDAAAPSPQRPPKAARALTAEAARAALLAKVTKAGAKGATTLATAKAWAEQRTQLTTALEELLAAEEIYVDRRKAKPRYFLWSERPALPTAEAVAEELGRWVESRFPLLSTVAEAKKYLGQRRDEAALLPSAWELLVQSGRVVELQQRTGRKETLVYVATAPLRNLLGAPPTPALPKASSLVDSYEELVRRTGFPAVMISDLQQASGTGLAELHAWLQTEHRAGRAVLSLGDSSLATPEQQAAGLEMHGHRYLQTRLLP